MVQLVAKKKNGNFTISSYYREIQKSFYQVGNDSGNECRWAATYLARIYMRIKNMFFSLLVSEGVIIGSRTDPRSRISLPRLIIIFIINQGQ
jgi:hypothetical protein